MRLYRPVGQPELELIEASGMKRFPPRLAGQPIFYPVCNYGYAAKIARDWNIKDPASGFKGYVTEFDVDDVFISAYETHLVGDATCEEYWIPAEDLERFNDSIRGGITIVASFAPAP